MSKTNFSPDDFLSARDIQELTGAKSIELCWSWLREKRIEGAFKVGRGYVVPRKDFERFWKEHKPIFEKWRKDRAEK